MSRSLWAGCALLGSALLVEVLGAAFGLSGEGLTMLGLALLTILVCGVPFVLDEARPPARRHTVVALFALAFLLGYAVPVFFNYLPSGAFAKPGNISPRIPLKRADTIVAQAVALLALVFTGLAYALPIGRWAGRTLPPLRREWSLVECEVVGFGMLAVGWTITALGVIGLIPRNLGSGVINTLASFRIYATVVFAYAFIRYRSPTSLILLLITIVPSSILGFFSGSKQHFLQPLALVVFTGMLYTGRIRFRWIALGVVGISLLYPTAVFYRQVILNGNTLPVIVPLSHPTETLHRVQTFVASQKVGETLAAGFEQTGGRLDDLGPTAVIVRDTPRVSPFQEGRTLMLFFYSFVPRVLWPHKPSINIGQWITDTYGPGPQVRSATGPSIIGDLYLNFGLWSVVGGVVIFGIALRAFHEWTLARTRNAPTVLLSAVLAGASLHIVMGSVAGCWGVIVFTVVPLVAIHLAVRMLFGSPRGAPRGIPDAARGGAPL